MVPGEDRAFLYRSTIASPRGSLPVLLGRRLPENLEEVLDRSRPLVLRGGFGVEVGARHDLGPAIGTLGQAHPAKLEGESVAAPATARSHRSVRRRRSSTYNALL